MATNFTLALDTTAPAGASVSIDAGAAFATTRDVTLTVGTTDPDTTGYQMLIWGDVDAAFDANVQATEGASTWVAFNVSKAVRLSTGDGSKTINVKIRDAVWNPTGAAATDSISLSTATPVPNISVAPDFTTISKVAGKRTSTFSWTSDTDFTEYKIKVVPATSSTQAQGVTILTTNGSTNMAATGTFPAATPISSAIDGRDLEVASAGDGDKIIKVFVKTASGIWSV